jgi:hypothetical protein
VAERLGFPLSERGKWKMRILTYKRTHVGDPDEHGRFGINNCMGRIRAYSFDAVIGVGGIGQEPKSYGIDQRINWVGIKPKRKDNGAVVTFETFLLLDEHGPLLEKLAPNLAKRMYEKGARVLLYDYSKVERLEALSILKWSRNQRGKKVRPTENKPGCHGRCRTASKKQTVC